MGTRRLKYIWIVVLLPLLALACNLSLPIGDAPKVEIPTIAPPPTPLPVRQEISGPVLNEDDALIDLYRHINPAVVQIIIFGDEGGALLPIGEGSGFVYDLNGNIITNAHVVHGAQDVEVIFFDDTRLAASIVGEDIFSDLAVVKVDSLPAEAQPLTLGNMEDVAVGQTVIAIGNPFGFGGTLTRGIVSAMGRVIPTLTAFSIPKAIQTDAAINPGNSGGPLLNLRGEVIGVNSQIITDGENSANSGVGFAIPVSIVSRVVPELIANQEYRWAWLGVTGGSVTPSLVEAMKLPVQKGAYIAEVINGGPSDKAGLRGASRTVSVDGRQIGIGGDVIIGIDGQPVNSFDDILEYIALNVTPGQTVVLTIVRDGETQELEIVLEQRPAAIDNPIQP